MPKHKHADLIIAWANGDQIQLNQNGTWVDCDPAWLKDNEYRIKPERVWPVSTMTDGQLLELWKKDSSLRTVANAAIKRYIEDNEK